MKTKSRRKLSWEEEYYQKGYIECINSNELQAILNHDHVWTLKRDRNICIRCGLFRDLIDK